ncbi:MAG: T9SS type A sorting domain-containing protein [Acidobacteriota bacterium]
MKRRRLVYAATAACLLWSAVPSAAQVDYATQIQPIFNANCIGCHGGTSGVTLSSYASATSSVGAQYGTKVIQPGSSASSPLYDKVSNAVPQHGARMPRGGPALSSAQITLIKNWIDEGAKEKPSATSVAERVSSSAPKSFALLQNYPNPFNPSTTIGFALASCQYVRLRVYDVLGRAVGVLEEGVLDAGTYRFTYDASELPSGIYFYQLEAFDASGSGKRVFAETRKLIVQK